jgi:hypothetical protein
MSLPETTKAPEGANATQSPVPTTALPHIVPDEVVLTKNWCARVDRRLAKMARKAAKS